MTGTVNRFVGLLALVAFSATACSRPTGAESGPIAHPSGPDELVLRVATGGGYKPYAWRIREIPEFSLLGDGSIVVPGPRIAIYPAPALPSLTMHRVSEEGIQAILLAAREAGLLRLDGSYGQDVPIADLPTTRITVVAGGERHVVSVYGLHDAGGEDDLRRALLDFTGRISDLARWLPEGSMSPAEEFSLDRLRVVSYRYDPDFFLQSEPGPEQPEMDWPLPGDLASFGEPLAEFAFAGFRCAAVEGSDLQTLLAAARQANELTPWMSGGQRFGVVLRPLLPDEPPCPEG